MKSKLFIMATLAIALFGLFAFGLTAQVQADIKSVKCDNKPGMEPREQIQKLPGIKDVSMVSTTHAASTIAVTVCYSHGETVYLQHKKGENGTWSSPAQEATIPQDTTTPDGRPIKATGLTFILEGLDPDSRYFVRASLSNNFSDPKTTDYMTSSTPATPSAAAEPNVAITVSIDAGAESLGDKARKLRVLEGTTKTFKVALTAAPANDVEVTLHPVWNICADCRPNGSHGYYAEGKPNSFEWRKAGVGTWVQDPATSSAPTLTFTPTEWNTPQTVSVRGIEDDDDRDEFGLLSARSVSLSTANWTSVYVEVEDGAVLTSGRSEYCTSGQSSGIGNLELNYAARNVDHTQDRRMTVTVRRSDGRVVGNGTLELWLFQGDASVSYPLTVQSGNRRGPATESFNALRLSLGNSGFVGTYIISAWVHGDKSESIEQITVSVKDCTSSFQNSQQQVADGAPDPVNGLSVESGKKRLTVTWRSDPLVDQYIVKTRRMDGQRIKGQDVLRKKVNGSKDKVVFKKLKPGEYAVSIRAQNRHGKSEPVETTVVLR